MRENKMTTKNDYKYSIGDLVNVSGFVKFIHKNDHGIYRADRIKIRNKFKKTHIGVVVGATHKYSGKTDYEMGEYPYFRPEKSHFLWQVKFSLRGKIYHVDPDQIEFKKGKYKIPITYTGLEVEREPFEYSMSIEEASNLEF